MNITDNATLLRRPAFATAAGLLGVLAFSFTLPFTRVAAPALGGIFVGVARAAGAGLLAGAVLLLTRARPPRGRWRGLAVVAGGVAIGFPVCASVAMRFVPASHGVVVVGLLPLVTSAIAAVRAGERPPPAFWGAASVGAVVVGAYALGGSGSPPQAADLLLGVACLAAAVGYAEGAILARELGGAAVIAWAMVLALPVTVPATLVAAAVWPPAWTLPAAGGLAYLAVVSNYLGFVAWYHGLAHGGVARVGALQLAQPFFGVVWCAALLGERVTVAEVAAVLVVVPCIVVARRGAATAAGVTGKSDNGLSSPTESPAEARVDPATLGGR